MALIKCIECGQDLSTDAFVCPHCGKPSIPTSVRQYRSRKRAWKTTIESIILASILIGGAYFLREYQISSSTYSGQGTFLGNLTQNFNKGNYQQVLAGVFSQEKEGWVGAVLKDRSKEITLQKVQNVGYVFYVGQVDYPNTPAISDEIKTEITKAINNAHFPKSLLKNIPIVFLNSLAITSGQYIATPNGDIPLIDRGPSLLSEGGLYVTNPEGKSVIYINNNLFDSNKSDNAIVNAFATEANKGKLTEIITHELGHAIDRTLTDQDWERYYQLRKIPAGTPRQGQSWNMSPQEDFAEVYKNTFTGLEVRTNYGILVPIFSDIDIGTCMKIHLELQNSYMPKTPTLDDFTAYSKYISNPPKIDFSAIESKITTSSQMQNCRKDVLSNPSKYPTEWQYGAPYKSSVDQQTKNFISEVASRLN